jgi:hypothetical protein
VYADLRHLYRKCASPRIDPKLDNDNSEKQGVTELISLFFVLSALIFGPRVIVLPDFPIALGNQIAALLTFNPNALPT